MIIYKKRRELKLLPGERINAFMHRHNRHKHMNTVTFIMFILLAFEKIASGATMRLEAGKTFFDFTF